MNMFSNRGCLSNSGEKGSKLNEVVLQEYDLDRL